MYTYIGSYYERLPEGNLMYVNIHIHIYIYIYIYIYVSICIHEDMCMFSHINIYIYMCIYIYIFIGSYYERLSEGNSMFQLGGGARKGI
jgi:hypothetical protein